MNMKHWHDTYSDEDNSDERTLETFNLILRAVDMIAFNTYKYTELDYIYYSKEFLIVEMEYEFSLS